MEPNEIRMLIHQVSKETVRETLKNIGFDTDNPREMQADLRYLTQVRKGSEFLSMRIKATLIASLIPTFLYLIWQAFKRVIQ